MAKIKLQLPILVQSVEIEGRSHYHLRPLFLPHPVTTNRRFELALSQLRQEIKHYFTGFTLRRSNMEAALWYFFNPEIQYYHFECEFNLGKKYTRGLIGSAAFQLRDLTFVCLPLLQNFTFIARASPRDRPELKLEVDKVAHHLLRQRRREEKSDFEPEPYFSSRQDFLTELKLELILEEGPFKFEEPSAQSIFMRLFEETDFEGVLELEKVGFDLNASYPAELNRAFLRSAEVDRLYPLVFHKKHTPLVIVGREGVGRHTLVHELVWRYMGGYYEPVAEPLRRIWQIDPTRIISGMSIIGRWQKRFEAILDYLRSPDGEAETPSEIAVIDNPVALLRIGKSAQNNMTLGDVLRPYLEKRELQLILIATPEEWKVLQEQDRRFSDLFQVFRLEEPDFQRAAAMVLQQRRLLERAQDVRITIKAIDQLFNIQRNYLQNRALPGSIMRLLRQLAIKHRFQEVDAQEVREEFKLFSGLREQIFDAGNTLKVDEVRQRIGQQLVGQAEAVNALADVIHLIKAKLSDKSRPIASFLFIGPTGVGKTQAAKVLCNYLMGNEAALLRFDMNEFIDPFAVQRLIGDYEQPEGLLTGKVRYQPFGVLLLDEIEKAHYKVYDLLLQILDDGRLTDSLGRTVDFSNLVIIMTSNVGAERVSSQPGYRQDAGDRESIYRKAVENYFRPELINRIDRILIFNVLELEDILGIARLQIRELLRRDGFVRRTTILNISNEALEWVARRGFNALMGGRALKRQIEQDLTALSAEQLISTLPDTPILLDIYLEEGQLSPRIHPLDFVSPLSGRLLPQLPNENQGRSFFGRLLRAVEQMEEEVRQSEETESAIVIGAEKPQPVNWLAYHFKNKLLEVKENIRNQLLGFHDPYFQRAPAIPLRLKRRVYGALSYAESKGEREDIRDQIFQEEGLREISEAYQFATAQFDSIKTEFINNYLDVVFLRQYLPDFLRDHPETIVLSFRSLVTGIGQREIGFLVQRYLDLLKALDLPHKTDETHHCITVEGYGLGEVFRAEAGIHLFYVAHRHPLPVYLEVRSADSPSPPMSYTILRIYYGDSTLSDLRTGYTNELNITTYEHKLLLYGGLPPGQRDLMQGLIRQ